MYLNTGLDQRNLHAFNKRLLQDNVARLICALPINLLKSMTHDLDLKVTQVHSDGTA